jgi:hypothetical protein
MPMKVIVTGPRKFKDFLLLKRKLDRLLSKVRNPVIVLVHGGGCWKQADAYAFEKRLTRVVHHPQKQRDSFAMWSVAHEEACQDSDALISFGEDSENRDFLVRARKHGLKIREIKK